MGEVKQIGAARGSHLMTVDFYRLPNGEIEAVLTDMPVHVIEAEATIAARFIRASEWLLGGMLSFMRQAVRFDEETRESMNDNRSDRKGG